MIRRPPRSTLFPTRRSSDLLLTSPPHQVGVDTFQKGVHLGPVELAVVVHPSTQEHTPRFNQLPQLLGRQPLKATTPHLQAFALQRHPAHRRRVRRKDGLSFS